MQKLILFFLGFFTLICCNTRPVLDHNGQHISILSGCPADGKCTVEMTAGKSLVVHEDEFGNRSYELMDEIGTNVYKVAYNRNVPEGVQDGTYREEIIFESKNENKSSVLQGNALQNAKLLFGRFCYCKGQTGYYKITDGTLRISGNTGERVYSLDFKTDKTPQVLNSVTFSIRN
ncbi:hypothetical protein [Flavobacterium sp.]|uniref:hypothetical protein n=1 Tax=Flavobacterium sp. TaxID=239 RepID=UPI00261C7E2C|nr:hypothetical protein [Flavobacterium sp.]